MDDTRLPLSFTSSSIKKKSRRTAFDSPNWRNWSELPQNALEEILDRLTVVDDYARIGAVCRRWRNILHVDISNKTISNKTNTHCSQPFLLIPSVNDRTGGDAMATLYSLSTDKEYGFHFSFPREKFFQGSSFGWLVTMERKEGSNYQVQLQNPFLSKGHIIDLPPLDDIQMRHVDIDGIGGWKGHYVCKAVLSSNPSTNNDFIVMAIMSRYRGLAFYNSSATAWASIGNWRPEYSRSQWFHDVIFFQKKKEFYALRCNGEVLAIKVQQGGSPTQVQVMPPVSLFNDASRAYLVEDSEGDLLAISKFRGKQQQHPYKLTVHKLNPGEWIKIYNLGNNILFLGNNSSMARPLSYCPGCQKNCIYFTDDVHSSYPCEQFCGPPSSGIYNLEDGITRPHFGPKKSLYVLSAPIWLDPTLFPSIYDD